MRTESPESALSAQRGAPTANLEKFAEEQKQINKFLASYGRRKGRKLTPARKELMEESQDFFIKYFDHENSFCKKDLVLEIGFGSGEHLAAMALNNPGQDFIGAETFLDGCGALVKKISEHKIKNIRIFNDDARLLLEQLPEESVSKTFILFPDPWPKNRHNKRRIINAATLDLLHRIMKPKSKLRLATDHQGYAGWMVTQIMNNDKFLWRAETKADWESEPEDHYKTRYQQKALAGNKYYFIEAERI